MRPHTQLLNMLKRVYLLNYPIQQIKYTKNKPTAESISINSDVIHDMQSHTKQLVSRQDVLKPAKLSRIQRPEQNP